MTKPCSVTLVDDWGDKYCYVHGTRVFADRAWDAVDEADTRTWGKWSESDVDKLRQMLRDGKTVKEIALALNRSTYSIYNKLAILDNGEEETSTD